MTAVLAVHFVEQNYVIRFTLKQIRVMVEKEGITAGAITR